MQTPYRTQDEIDEWKTERDPITMLKEWLIAEKLSDETTLSKIDEEAKATVADSVSFGDAGTPLDEDTLCAAAARTGRVVIVDESRDRCSAASHIAAVIADRSFSDLKAPVKRVTTMDCSFPYAPASEKYLMPTTEKVIATATALVKS